MAFNPFKNRKISEPVFEEQVEKTQSRIDSAEDGINYEENVVSNENLSYEGEKVSDLQESGLKTTEVLNNDTPKVMERQKFNLPLLESLPLSFVLEQLGAEKKNNNSYQIFDNEISLKENKWYNVTLRRGKINAISLVKHITAIKEKLDEKESDKHLFLTACKFLNEIQNKQQQHEIVEKTTEQVTTPVANEQERKQERTPEQNAAYWKELTEQLNNISLNLVMEYIGATPNEDGQRGKWKTPSGDNVAVTGQQWYSWKTREGGIGAISFLAFHLAEINNIDTRSDEQKKAVRRMAIRDLIKTFGDGDLSLIADSGENITFKQPFVMPHIIDFKINQVRQYLNEKRGLPLWIINKQISSGLLFAGFPSDWQMPPKFIKSPQSITDDYVWATFLSANGTAAEMRAIERTDGYAKMLAKGSDKDLGGFVLKAEKDVSERTVAALEAAIDSMSYHAFYPGRIATSCMGVTFNLAAKAAIEALERNYSFQLAFDNDQAGNESAIRFKEEVIDEIGLEEYQSYYQEGKIKYFDLGIRCLKECMEQDKIFYLDVQNNNIGIEVVKLFQEQSMLNLGQQVVKDYVAKGKVKYLNLCPTFEMVQDVQKEAEIVFSKLNTGKPYYLRIIREDEDKPEIQEKITAFINAFKVIAGNKYQEWELNGSIIYNKIAVAKDWNEYFIYMKNNHPEFVETLNEQEKQYIHYSEQEAPKNSRKKSRKMG